MTDPASTGTLIHGDLHYETGTHFTARSAEFRRVRGIDCIETLDASWLSRDAGISTASSAKRAAPGLRMTSGANTAGMSQTPYRRKA